MADAPAGERAAGLPWLCPAGPALLALADDRPDPAVLAADPAAVLLALRYTRPAPQPADVRLDSAAFGEPLLADAAAALLESCPPSRAVHPIVADLLRFARRTSGTAADLARGTNLCPPATAAAAALLAPLGWLLVAEVEPIAAVQVRDAIAAGDDPTDAQRSGWGVTHGGIVRRVADRWRLPRWVAAVVANLGHPAATAIRLGAPPGLFEVVRASVAAADSAGVPLRLVNTAERAPGELLPAARQIVDESARRVGTPEPSGSAHAPIAPAILVRLLRTAARARRAEGAARLAQVHAELDHAHDELARTAGRFEERVRDAKLAALAELAAGAGHEINNPLAVISGNAQRLLARADDPEQRKALEAVVRQSRRIADIVQDLMQFARPRPPARRPFGLAAWLAQVADECRPVAAVKGVELQVEGPGPAAIVHADPTQLGRALAALVRNGIEAAPSGGCVRITAGVHGPVGTVVVEDSGPGPGEAAAEHLFDPFYSGRSAGRGRGLGLPTAWRLARENGGTVRYDPAAGGPTRFVLELPLYPACAEPAPERKSA